jgi:hypothetical protein
MMFVDRLGNEMAGGSGNKACFGGNGNRKICIKVEIMRCLSERSVDLT